MRLPKGHKNLYKLMLAVWENRAKIKDKFDMGEYCKTGNVDQVPLCDVKRRMENVCGTTCCLAGLGAFFKIGNFKSGFWPVYINDTFGVDIYSGISDSGVRNFAFLFHHTRTNDLKAAVRRIAYYLTLDGKLPGNWSNEDYKTKEAPKDFVIPWKKLAAKYK